MHAKDTIHIDAPVGAVDRLALQPDAWWRYFVGMSEPEEIDGDGGPGTKVKFRMHPPGSPAFSATALVMEYDHRLDGSVYWYGEFSGGNAGWETWELVPQEGGSTVTVEMEVQPAGGALVRAAANLLVERPLRRNVHQSLHNLKQLAESSEPVREALTGPLSPATRPV